MFDGFVRIEGISGESSDEKHAGWIEIMNFDLDVSQTVNRLPSSLGGAGAERADFSEFRFTKLLDKASPKLALACAADGDFPEDEVSFVYGKVEWCYTQQKRAGGWISGNVAAGWSLEKKCKA